MTVTDPIPTTDYGKGNWQDYISNWRQKDAGWVQERSILRYANAGTGTGGRGAEWPSPKAGQVTYRADADRLEMWSGLRSSWASILMFQYLTSGSDTAANVNISHANAAGKGVNFTPTSVIIDLPLINGVLTTTTNNVGIQTPAMGKALLTTNGTGAAAELISDTKMAMPGLRLTGTGGVIDATGKAVTTGALTATSLALGGGSITGAGSIAATSLTASGAVAGATLNISGTGTLGGASGTVFNGTWIAAPQGFVANNGYFNGDSTGAIMAYRNSTNGAVAAAQLTADSTRLNLRGGQGMLWWNAAGQGVAWISPVIVSGTDPGANNYPDGTIWIQP